MCNNFLGIYIHIPFCVKKCLYCNFYSIEKLNLIDRFVEYLCKEINLVVEQYTLKEYIIDSIYFGGGTPNLLSIVAINKILNILVSKFNISAEVEISFEFNPNLCTKTYLEGLASLKINRISVGVQSADDNQLKSLGRLHNFSQAQKAINMIIEAGITNISADLMLGISNQSSQSLQNSLEKFAELNLTHISIYQLKIEKGTSFFVDRPLNLPTDDETAQLFEQAVVFLNELGFKQYEVSNLAKEGFECVHNLKYWTLKPYLGFGPSAHSYFEGKRFYNESKLDNYIQGNFNKKEEQMLMSPNFEWLMLVSRLNHLILFSDLRRHGFSEDKIKERLKYLARSNLVYLCDDGFKLTTKGFLVQNSILIYITDDR